MPPTVYIETTIVSYLTARPSRDLIVASHQQLTAEWWDRVRPQVACFVSDFVIQEAERGDAAYAQKRLEAVRDFLVLGLDEEISGLAQKYFAALQDTGAGTHRRVPPGDGGVAQGGLLAELELLAHRQRSGAQDHS